MREEIEDRVMGKVPKQLESSAARLVAEKNKGLGTKYGKSKPVSVMLPPDLENWVRSLDNRSEWIREAITEKYEREQLKASDAS
jgi:hypothetical protein